MRRGLIPGLRALPRDESGASLLEFALIAPVLGVLAMGISDAAMCFATKLRFEQAASTALEKAAVVPARSDYSFLREDAATEAGVSEEEVTVEAWLSCNGQAQSDFNARCGQGEPMRRYVRVTIASAYTPSFDYGPLAPGARADGRIPVTASAALRIE